MSAEFWTIIGTTVAVCAFVYSVIRNFKEDMKKRFDKIDQRFDKHDNEIKEIRTSLNRMEGAFYSKECCMFFNNEKKKAE